MVAISIQDCLEESEPTNFSLHIIPLRLPFAPNFTLHTTDRALFLKFKSSHVCPLVKACHWFPIVPYMDATLCISDVGVWCPSGPSFTHCLSCSWFHILKCVNFLLPLKFGTCPFFFLVFSSSTLLIATHSLFQLIPSHLYEFARAVMKKHNAVLELSHNHRCCTSKFKVWAGPCSFCRGQGRTSRPLSQLMEVCYQSWEFLSFQVPHPNFCLYVYTSVSKFPLSRRTYWIRGPPDSSMTSPQLIIFPNKVKF